jgi:hypothetical protein
MDAWTDERLDDLAATLRPLPAQMARNTEAIERITEDIRAMRGDMTAMRADMAALRSDFSSSQRQIAQIGWAMATAVVALLIALVIAAV